MPDEQKPDASSEEELQAAGNGAVANNVAEENVEAAESDEVAETPQAEEDGPPEDGAAGASSEEQAEADAAAAGEGESDFEAVVNDGDVSEDDAEAAMLAMLEEEGQKVESEVQGMGNADDFPDLSGIKMEESVANPAEFQQLNASRQPSGSLNNIDMLLDVKMPVAIELGRTEMPISELLALGPGSVVELNKLAGEPVDLLVNNRIIARGEVVVVDENFGVRITQLLSPEERIKSLAEN